MLSSERYSHLWHSTHAHFEFGLGLNMLFSLILLCQIFSTIADCNQVAYHDVASFSSSYHTVGRIFVYSFVGDIEIRSNTTEAEQEKKDWELLFKFLLVPGTSPILTKNFHGKQFKPAHFGTLKVEYEVNTLKNNDERRGVKYFATTCGLGYFSSYFNMGFGWLSYKCHNARDEKVCGTAEYEQRRDRVFQKIAGVALNQKYEGEAIEAIENRKAIKENFLYVAQKANPAMEGGLKAIANVAEFADRGMEMADNILEVLEENLHDTVRKENKKIRGIAKKVIKGAKGTPAKAAPKEKKN